MADVRSQARGMSLAALKDKVHKARENCALMQMRLDQVTEEGQQNTPEVRSIVAAHALACAWASQGAAEIQRREKEAAKPARRAPAPRAPAPAAEPAAPVPDKKGGGVLSALVGIGGVAAIGGLAWWGIKRIFR